MLIRFLILVHVCTAFPLKCPEPAQWSTRARGFCPDPSKYFCLKNDLINGYSENCTIFDFLQPGRKHVLRGGLDADICSSERYQPWPILFYTNVSTNCIFRKSACNEEGQVVYDDGNRSTDITCRCDYTRGYDFVAKPRNRCFCVPSEEDCSCHLKMCPKSTDKLSPDYECLEEEKNLTVSECKTIISVRTNKTKDDNTKKYILDSENMSNEGSILFICMGLLLNELLDRYYREVYFIYQPLSDIELIEGQTARLKYKLSTNRFPVSFLKDNQFFRETTFIKKSVVGRSKTLEFTYVAPTDAGTYCLKVAEMTSNHIKMIIKPMFTSKIDPLKSLEGNKLELVCSVYADDIVVQWYKENEQVHDCENMLIDTNKNQHRLTIKKAAIMDSGKYYVKAGNVQMEIPVIVKDIFRRPLVDVTIMEGLDTKFEFETEEENVPVQWFYNKKEIIESTERRQISRLQGRVHTLTIYQTRLEDSGKYSIRIKAYDKFVELNVKEMPETIKNMSVYDREAFLKAANSGTTKRYNIRVMIVGKQSAGKTCLLRRLMNEEIDDVISTDGINIERRKCLIDIKTGVWHFYKSGQKPEFLSIDKSEEFADCAFWDFAGQKEFYATHQTFLSANAVYLLVVDISEDFKSKTYENMIEKEFDSIGEYIDFWLDNIHCYCTDDTNTSMECNDDLDLNPPVIIIGTGIDKIPLNGREERKTNFLKHLNSAMSKQEKRRHFRQPHFLSNKIPSENKQEFEELRTDILRKAKALSNWEENLPIRWIVLEKEMYRKQTETTIFLSEAQGETLRCKNKKVILYTEAQRLATKCSFPDVQKDMSELDSFLKYEHEIGNIIFFKEVREYIVLDPEWLVDVFRCFVSHDYNGEALGMPEWAVLDETGKLEDALIEKLLKKVPTLILTKHKQYLLKLMEEFGIIVKPKNEDYRNDIYMPCMIKPRPFQEILRNVDDESKHCKKSAWFSLVFNFLPPSYFNHILVSFVKNQQLCHNKNDSNLSMYRNIGIFQLNDTGSEILVICLSKNLIAMQVRQLQSDDVCYSYVKDELINLVDLIKQRYRINVTYEIRFKCPGGSLSDNAGISYDGAMENSEYRCTYHNEMHLCKDVYRSWLKV
ncbi:Hypothetical predicted protein [Mytilus galloprovincialis]|uniref:non-specific serine/threonine protein kinase n=1 Tax=Mytilus galloprovincialis TaxID=29158 RepID=A0A8B6H240_MYTGA|nr:Hypothetical predicted protein [Mytilus galloprovincialis]